MSTPANACAFTYSSYMTPAMIGVPSGSISSSQKNLTISGSFMGITDPALISVQVGGVVAPILNLTVSNMTIGLPSLPAGNHLLKILVSGYGFSRAPLTYLTDANLFIR